MKRALLSLLLLVAAIAVIVQHPEAQLSGGIKLIHEQDTPPTNVLAPWIRNLDRQTFEYSDSLAVWVGQPYMVWSSKNATNVTGPLKFGQACQYDTTTGAEVGWYMPEDMQLLRGFWSAANEAACNCSTMVFLDGTMDTLWEIGAWADGNIVIPTGAIADSGSILSVFIHPNATSATNPDYPNVWLEFRPIVSP